MQTDNLVKPIEVPSEIFIADVLVNWQASHDDFEDSVSAKVDLHAAPITSPAHGRRRD